ncbi:MAG: class I SAM-dependent methyltransferase [Gammaproteobacteria bacterium]|nr:class I SAM-dependent methyltransferase [Gammaproteobacteria bacterium]
MNQLDAAQIKQGQQRDWNSVAGGWERWWPALEAGAAHVSQRLLDAAAVRSGGRVLDVATGIGEPALSAARRVGDTGHVLAIDQAADMLAIARRRAATAGVTNVEFLHSDGEGLPPGLPPFDAIVCRWGLMFFPDPGQALRSLHPLLLPGGRIAATVWSTADRVPSISLPLQIVSAVLDLPPPPPGRPNPFSLADHGLLHTLFADAGFTDIIIDTLPVTFTMPSAADYTRFTLDISAPLVALLAGYDETRRQQAIAAITARIAGLAAADGAIRLQSEAILISAMRPI